MKERWLPVGLVAGGLFVANLIARLVVRLTAGSDENKQATIGIWALVAVGAVLIPVAYLLGRRHPVPRVVGDLALAVVAACLLAVLVGPYVSGSHALAGGFGLFVTQFFYFGVASGIGVVLGLLVLLATGKDYKSQGWKRYIEQVNAKPVKRVRR